MGEKGILYKGEPIKVWDALEFPGSLEGWDPALSLDYYYVNNNI